MSRIFQIRDIDNLNKRKYVNSRYIKNIKKQNNQDNTFSILVEIDENQDNKIYYLEYQGLIEIIDNNEGFLFEDIVYDIGSSDFK